jgi:putative oxidoreductase
MNSSTSLQSVWAPRALSILRIVTGLLYLWHGSQKLFGFPPSGQPGPPFQFFSIIGLAGVLEFFGGVLILIGLFTRPVAFILSGQMAAAYFMAHAPQAFLPIVNRGEMAVLYCFVFLYFAVAGGGVWSLDNMRRTSPAGTTGDLTP